MPSAYALYRSPVLMQNFKSNTATVINPRACMRGRVIVYSWSVCVRASVCQSLSVNRFSREPCLLWAPNVEVWTSTMGALYSKKLERR